MGPVLGVGTSASFSALFLSALFLLCLLDLVDLSLLSSSLFGFPVDGTNSGVFSGGGILLQPNMTRVRGPRRGLNELELVDLGVQPVDLEVQLVELEVDGVLVVLDDLEVLAVHEGRSERGGGLHQTHAQTTA